MSKSIITPALVALSSTVTLSACHFHEHVNLKAPNPGAPIERRVAAYETLAPEGSYVRKEVVGLIGGRTRRHEGLRLMNGVGVECPLDLLPLVESNSTVRQAAQAWEEHNTLADVLFMGVAAPVGTLSFLALLGGAYGGEKTMATLGGVGLGLSFGVVIAATVFSVMAAADKRRALSPRLYRAALRERLRLCPEGIEHGVCSE